MVAIINPQTGQYIDMNRSAIRAIWNAEGGAQIKWDDTLGEWTTVAGDRYCAGDVEDRVKQIVRRQEAE